MIPRKNKINRQNFTKTSQKSKKIEDNLFSIKVHFPTNSKDKRFSVVVSSKLSKSAVERNKIKRRIYSILDQFIVKNGQTKPFWAIIYPKKPSLNSSFKDLENSLKTLTKELVIDK